MRKASEIKAELAALRAEAKAESARLEALGGTAWADGQAQRDVVFARELELCAELSAVSKAKPRYQARGNLDHGAT